MYRHVYWAVNMDMCMDVCVDMCMGVCVDMAVRAMAFAALTLVGDGDPCTCLFECLHTRVHSATSVSTHAQTHV